MSSIELLRRHQIVPVVVLDDVDHAIPLAGALVEGGLPIAEVTFRTPAAIESIRRMRERGDIAVGAGTVLTPSQVDAAVDAGAEFVVSPGFSPAVVTRCAERGVLALPGATSATEIMAALEIGIEVVKFFPAGISGGAAAVAALAAPFPQVSFVPTGGITAQSAGDYLSLPSVIAVGGSWMVPRDTVAAGDFAAVRRLVANSVAAVSGPGSPP